MRHGFVRRLNVADDSQRGYQGTGCVASVLVAVVVVVVAVVVGVGGGGAGGAGGGAGGGCGPQHEIATTATGASRTSTVQPLSPCGLARLYSPGPGVRPGG
ncbi:hypothetical protein LZ30DRAFT_693375 [Colletotrichum cereale]|nr:hypothetical protein LZ30DRAFT_693375 [Colletotrichum cereale]